MTVGVSIVTDASCIELMLQRERELVHRCIHSYCGVGRGASSQHAEREPEPTACTDRAMLSEQTRLRAVHRWICHEGAGNMETRP